jgi:hypothetical protein
MVQRNVIYKIYISDIIIHINYVNQEYILIILLQDLCGHDVHTPFHFCLINYGYL